MSKKRETFKFERISEDNKVYLISSRQKKEINSHGAKFHKHPNKTSGLTCMWWYLLPGAYYVYEYAKNLKGYYVHRLIIREIQGQLIEEHRPVDSIPDWLKKLIETLPEYQEKDLEKYSIYTTSR